MSFLPAMTGNGNHSTYENGDWGMVDWGISWEILGRSWRFLHMQSSRSGWYMIDPTRFAFFAEFKTSGGT